MQRILIIDDDPDGTRLLSTLLQLEGYQPLALENWEDPLHDVEQHQPDLVIMDIFLHAKNGLDLLSELRASPNAGVSRTPVLMMSAEDRETLCRQLGANGFLAKPFNIQHLLTAIHEIEKEGLSNS